MVAWGYNISGQTNVPAGLSNVVAIAAGGLHTLAVRADGVAIAWGDNSSGQTNVPAGLTDLLSIAGGAQHSLALIGAYRPILMFEPESMVMSAGSTATFSVTAVGPPPLSYQWRFNGQDIAGATANEFTLVDLQLASSGNYSVVVANAFGAVTSAPASLTVTPEITPREGWVVAWGYNLPGQTDVLAGLSNVVGIAAGGGLHNLAVRADGTVVAWGENGSGQTNVPTGLSNVVGVAAGVDHSLALRRDGTVVAWGNNWSGQTDVPVGLKNVVSIAAGAYHNLALLASGRVVAWGSGPTIVPAGLSNVVAIAASGSPVYGSVNLALRADGTVVAWSYIWDQTNVPPGLSNVTAIAAGGGHSLALRQDGMVVAWGANSEGQTNVPDGLSNVVAIAGGDDHSLAVRADGTAVAWGRNDYGQTDVPPGMTNTLAIAGGWRHSLALVGSAQPSGMPYITEQPESHTLPLGAVAEFWVTATGTAPLSYQWQKDGVPLTDGPYVMGARDSWLYIAVLQTNAAGNYLVVVTNAYGSVTSQVAVLTVLPGNAPFITTQPQSRTNVVGTTATFAVTATGAPPLVYQWLKNGASLVDGGSVSGASTATMTLANAQTDDAGGYQVIVANAFGSVTSQVAMLTVTGCVPPIITMPPAALTTCIGEPASFTIGATGDGLTYQWRKNGVVITGATDSSLTIPAVALTDAGSYDCLVSNACGIAELSRNVVQTPGFEQGTAGWFVIGPCSLTATTSQAHSGQRSAYITGRTDTWNSIGQSLLGVLRPAVSYGISVWLRIEGTTSQTVGLGLTQVDGGGTHYWTIGSVVMSPGQWVRVMGGFTLNVSGTLTELTLHPDCAAAGVNLYVDDVLVEPMVSSGVNLAQNPGFEAGTGGWYVFGSCSLTAPTGQPHSGQRSAYIQGRTDIWNGPAQSLLGVVVPGQVYRIHAWVRLETAGAQPFELAIKQTDSSGTSYPWWDRTTVTSTSWTHLARDFSPNVVGSLSELTFFIQGPAAGINFYVDDIVVEPMAESFLPATLTVNSPPAITAQPSGATRNVGQAMTFSVTATGSSLTYQWRKFEVNIGGATGSSYTIAAVGSGDAGSYDCVVNGVCSPPVTSQAAMLVICQPPSITAHPVGATPCVGDPVTFSVSASGTDLTYQWRKGGVNIGTATASGYTIAAVATGDAGSYECVVSGACGSPVPSLAATLTVNSPPSITSQPSGATRNVGDSVTFSVAATGTDLVFQWRQGGVNIGGATGSSYTIAAVGSGDAGSYDCVVSGVCSPPVTSQTAMLVICQPPSITAHPVGATPCVGDPVTFSVSASGTDLTYQWRKGGVNIDAATASRHMIAAVATGDAGSYDCVVSGACGSPVPSLAATLTVNSPPSITSQPSGATRNVGDSVTFSVTATGTDLVFQWRKGGVNIGGATGSSYTIAAVGSGDAGSYDCVVSGVCGPPATSQVATLTITQPGVAPSITVQPQSRTNLAGTTATFSVAASGSAPLVYQWRKGGSDLSDGRVSGATTPTLTLACVQIYQGGDYTVVVSNLAGSVTSQVAVLTVRPPEQSPEGLVVAWGSNQWGETNVPASLSNVVAISTLGLHNLALKRDGTVVGWGDDENGQTNVPVGLSNVMAIGAGRYHSLALKNDGTVVGWGSNGKGQISPPPGLNNVQAIAAGFEHSLALRTDGTVVVWGGAQTMAKPISHPG